MTPISMLLPEDTSAPLPVITIQEPTALEAVAKTDEIAKQTEEILRRPLTGKDLELAKKWAKALRPANPAEPADFISLGQDELANLVEAQRNMLTTLSVKEMREVRAISNLLYKQIDSVDISKLSPKAQAKFLGLKETLQNIIDRIDAFFDRYRTVQGELDKLASQIIELRDTHIERKNIADRIGKETKASRNVLRIVAEACKIYLEEDGRPYREQLIAKVEKDAEESKANSHLPDETLTEELTAFKSYLVIVEGYMATTEGAIVDATQAFVALDMLEQNERIIAQGLNNLIVFTIPAWQRMIATAYIAAMGEQAADFIQKQNDKTNEMRKQTADILKMSFTAIAKMIKSGSFDDESMQYLTNALVEGYNIITEASVEAEKAHEISRVKGNLMIAQVNEAQVKYGTSGKRA